MRALLLVAVPVFLLGGLATALLRDGRSRTTVGEALGSEGSEPAPAQGSGEDERARWTELRATLARVEGRLTRIETQLARPAQVERVPSAPEPELAAELARLRAAVDGLQRQLAADPAEQGSELQSLELEKPEPDWFALDALIAEWQRDEHEATALVRLMGPTDVVRAYGYPSEMWTNDRGTHWVYGQGKTPEAEYEREVYLRFQDGYVVTVGIALR